MNEHRAFFFPGDTADIMPSAAAEHLEALRREAANAHAVLLSISDTLRDLNRTKDDVTVLRGQLITLNGLNWDDPFVLEEDKKIQRVNASIGNLRKDEERYWADWQQIAGLVTELEKFIQSPRANALLPYSGPAPKLGKGENYAGAVERCRRRVRELLADKTKFATAPHHSSRAKQLIRGELERYAELGRPDVGGVIDHAEPIRWPLNHSFEGERLLTPLGAKADGLALVAWLFKTQLIDALEKEIDAIADDAAALSEADRDRLLAEVERDLLAVQRDEEFFIRAANDAGASVRRRRDANPLAVLNLEGVSQ